MEKKEKIQVYVKPNGETVVRAFTIQDFLFYDEDGMLVSYKEVIKERSFAHQTGQHYGIQKNCMNDQIVKQNRDLACPEICPVKIATDIVEMATQLGANNSTDPLGIYQSNNGDTVFLTGDQITKYYRYVKKLVFPTILNAELKLFSCHPIRMRTAVLLHEAGKDGLYIKLRLRWLSD